MKKNNIDIFIPYWGDSRLLKTSINSVFSQSNQNWNLTVIDDNYPDKSALKYCKNIQDKRFRYIRNKKNLGITKNFNQCISLAKSKYIMIMGYDDELMPNYVDRALANIGEADFYQPGVNVIDFKGNKYLPLNDKVKKILQPKKSGLYQGEKLAASLCIGNWLYFPSITWKTETIARYGFNNKFTVVQDVCLELNIIKDGGKLYFDSVASFNYRRFKGSLSSKEKNGVRFKEESAVYKMFSIFFYKIGWKKAAALSRLHLTSRLHKMRFIFTNR